MKNKLSSFFSGAALSAAILASAGSIQTAQASVLLSGWNGSTESGFGQIAMSKNDDGSSREFTFDEFSDLGFDNGVNYFGDTFNGFFVNNNGNVTFGNSLSTFTPVSFPTANTPMIAPFWGDVDTRCADCGNVYLGSPDENTMVVTWDSVGSFSNNADTTNTFQLVLIDRADTGAGNFDVEFRYDDINWTSGTASNGVPAQAGYDAGDGVNFFTVPGSQTEEIANIDTANSNTDTAGLWRFAIREGALPGATPESPIYPVIDPSNPTTYNFEFEIIDPNTPIFIDPDVAVGYDFIVNNGPNIASVLLPTGFDDNLFDLWLWDMGLGDWFDANIVLEGGVSYTFDSPVDRFRILGIDVDNMLDPTDGEVFVTGLTFDAAGNINMDQIAITEFVDDGTTNVNAPSAILLVLSGGLMLFVRRRKLR
ncbi:nidogen-like domain-containing protein [Glaciecola sp. 2405UD65-10]|uniref:nidogen-like domain-containing protein n=1 Tax=Glaciecola sp. 2405UD65-10 TaxID=3397244 RepID=UPI003B599645